MDNKEEVFKEIANFPGYYISNFGNVKSSKTNRLLKIQKSSRYSTVGLINNAKRYNYLVHRLVAQAFILNPENKPTVNHKNHDTYDNRIENLEWNTQKEQNQYNYNTEKEKRKTNRARSVSCYNNKNELCMTFRTLTEASIWLFNQGNSKNVEACLAGIRHSLNNGWFSYNYIWKYNDLENKDLDGEIWKEIPKELTCGKTNYWLSNKGRYKNDKGKIVDIKNNNQYKCISFRNNKTKINHQLHRLVAQLFVENLHNKPIVNHIDGNKENNISNNLEWVTKSENTKHAHENGLIKKNSRKVNQYDKEGNFIAEYESIKLAATTLKLDKSTIGHICAKDRPGTKTCGGFTFEYAD